MKFRAKMRSHRRHSPRKKGDWIILSSLPCSQPVMAPAACDDAQVQDGTETAGVTFTLLVSPADIAEKEDSLTIVRIVGELTHVVKFNDPAFTHTLGDYCVMTRVDEHIYKSTNEIDGSVTALDPRAEVSLEDDSILWRRTSFYTWENITTLTSQALFNIMRYETRADEHVDIRVSRKLSQGEVLIHAIACTVQILAQPIGGGADLTVADVISATGVDCFFALRGYTKF